MRLLKIAEAILPLKWKRVNWDGVPALEAVSEFGTYRVSKGSSGPTTLREMSTMAVSAYFKKKEDAFFSKLPGFGGYLQADAKNACQNHYFGMKEKASSGVGQ